MCFVKKNMTFFKHERRVKYYGRYVFDTGLSTASCIVDENVIESNHFYLFFWNKKIHHVHV